MTSNRTAIDQLIDLEAAYKAAKDAYEAAKDKFVENNNNIGVYEGTERNVQIILSQRSVVDYDKLEKVFGVSKEQFELYSKCKKDGSTFTVVKVIDKKDAA